MTLVGDAGYCPGAVVGGSTGLTVVGAYVLAGEPSAAGTLVPAARVGAGRPPDLLAARGPRSLLLRLTARTGRRHDSMTVEVHPPPAPRGA
ncbi:hypothetical protein ABTY59_19485 [Streptomyces sp. NPDC096079]|uniref:hypothetical protein n=1 Tax=Streptomyces sp. NPDC096079 TaxID=3155820 RepID=UPI00332E578E